MLRPAGPEDMSRIAALIAAHPKALLAQNAAAIAGLAQEDGNHVLVWDRAGFAGFAIIERAYPEVYWLTNLAVSTPGAGEGRALIRAVQDFVFGTLGAHRLFLDTGTDNPAALAAFQAAGFVHEGTMRSCWNRPGDGWVDCAVLAMLRAEWEALP